MNHTAFQSNLATYLAGAAIGGAILASALAGAGQFRIDPWQVGAAPLVCLGQATAGQGAQLKAAVVAAEAWRDRVATGGSLYAAAKVGAPSASDAALLAAADDSLRAARARFLAACGLQG
jgi:hypothetical protein